MDLFYSTNGFPLQPWISSIQPLVFFPLQSWISSIQPLVSFSRFSHGFRLFDQWFLFPASSHGFRLFNHCFFPASAIDLIYSTIGFFSRFSHGFHLFNHRFLFPLQLWI
jgi:hypothetical protein